MPKKYPTHVQLFASQKRIEGYSWDEVAELVKQECGLDPPPSRRQMTKWVDQWTLPRRIITDTGDNMTWHGADSGVVVVKWMLVQMEEIVGPERLMRAWGEFTRERGGLYVGAMVRDSSGHSGFDGRKA